MEQMEISHVSTQDPIPTVELISQKSPPRGRPVGRSKRGGLMRGAGDDRLIAFVRDRTSRERSAEGSHGRRTRSRSNHRPDRCQSSQSPPRGSNFGSHGRSAHIDVGLERGASPEPIGGIHGNNLMLTSLDEELNREQPHPNLDPKNKGKVVALTPLSSSHRSLVHRLSQALANEPTASGGEEDEIDVDAPPDRGKYLEEEVIEGFGVAKVIDSDNKNFKMGDYVSGITG
ncbi:hypothetical protein J5N97_009946 [Dioscorea zingiberensis]|uniref:Uncharacterized protein n=1 Tax=Dioscorea zingiberensis TaxID=325984 RepID=A0A9D5HMD5_9LILI|nr:hypothetical protein J5N97_009946 [Dioscorea zingiberensis]